MTANEKLKKAAGGAQAIAAVFCEILGFYFLGYTVIAFMVGFIGLVFGVWPIILLIPFIFGMDLLFLVGGIIIAYSTIAFVKGRRVGAFISLVGNGIVTAVGGVLIWVLVGGDAAPEWLMTLGIVAGAVNAVAVVLTIIYIIKSKKDPTEV